MTPHDGVIKWKPFPRYWLFVRRIHRSPVNSPPPVMRSFDVFVDLHLNNRLSKHSWGWWFETLSRSLWRHCNVSVCTVYPKKYAYGFCFAVLCCGYTLTDFPISIRLTSLALWQSNDCPSASKATLMNMDKYFMWIHYERLHKHNKANHNKTVCIFLGIYCTWLMRWVPQHADYFGHKIPKTLMRNQVERILTPVVIRSKWM